MNYFSFTISLKREMSVRPAVGPASAPGDIDVRESFVRSSVTLFAWKKLSIRIHFFHVQKRGGHQLSALGCIFPRGYSRPPVMERVYNRKMVIKPLKIHSQSHRLRVAIAILAIAVAAIANSCNSYSYSSYSYNSYSYNSHDNLQIIPR